MGLSPAVAVFNLLYWVELRQRLHRAGGAGFGVRLARNLKDALGNCSEMQRRSFCLSIFWMAPGVERMPAQELSCARASLGIAARVGE